MFAIRNKRVLKEKISQKVNKLRKFLLKKELFKKKEIKV